MPWTVFDELATIEGDEEAASWMERLFTLNEDIVAFVSDRVQGRPAGRFAGYRQGSFNFSVRVQFGDGGSDVIIRFPKPGRTATCLRDEKVENEVRILQYLHQTTTIPIPCVISWGLTKDCPLELGPFIIMDYIDGEILATILKGPKSNWTDHAILDPDIDDAKLNHIYTQLAGYMVQLSKPNFSSIGALSGDPSSNTWSVTKRPLTYNSNELMTVVKGLPPGVLPTMPFTSTGDYFHHTWKEHYAHLCTQRNIADDAEEAEKRFIAHHQLRKLIPQYCIDNDGPFKIYCDDLQPANIIVDPKTLQIKSFLDWEFTNIMPAQFTYDPPWWLLLLGPDMWLNDGKEKEFMACFEPRLEQFLQALERVPSGPALAARMRESWRTKQFWFDYGMRKSFDLDSVYWFALRKDSGVQLDDETLVEKQSFVQVKMEQLAAYNMEISALPTP
ncbi:hypothetical protein FQN54_004664 [Arachnomyces sp. PD_36]|nr:hypothetical protein FQN54_004664 [Arachnomyces sp. PD_36]